MEPAEGVIQFEAVHSAGPLREAARRPLGPLLGWRSILRDTGLLGQTPHRYDGLGYGNVSVRSSARSLPRGGRSFVVSGTQSSSVESATAQHFAEVISWDHQSFRLTSRGPILPSSESLTHAAVYDQAPHIQCVMHVHSPEIWNAHRELRIPTTDPSIAYGTPEMAQATTRLFQRSRVWEFGVWVMLGHEDGVVAFGRDPDDAGTRLMRLLAAARGGGPTDR